MNEEQYMKKAGVTGPENVSLYLEYLDQASFQKSQSLIGYH